jgi:ABC-type uncharacterized transport system permease subunit
VVPVHIAHLATTHARKAEGQLGKPSRNRRRAISAAVAAGALSAGLAPAFASLLGDVHGDEVAAGTLIVLLSAGLGFGLARVIGKQR